MKKITFILIAFFFILAICLRVHYFLWVFLRGPDELVYLHQAHVLISHHYPVLIDRYLKTQIIWFYPPPIRIGFVGLLAATLVIFSHFNSPAILSLIVSCLSLGVLLLFALRFFNRSVALIALAFYAVNPISIALAGRVLQGSLVELLGALLIYLFFELISSAASNQKRWFFYFILIGSFTLLVKSSLFIFYGVLSLSLLCWLVFRCKTYKRALFFVIFAGVGFSIAVSILLYCVGGFSNLLAIYHHIQWEMPRNTYALHYQSGPWYHWFLGLWIMSPASFVMFLFAVIFLFFTVSRYRKYFLLMIAVLIFFFIAMMTPYCQNIRYVAMLFVPFYLLSAWGVCQIYHFVKVRVARRGVGLLAGILLSLFVILGVARDYTTYHTFYIKRHLYDPSLLALKIMYRKGNL